MSLVIEGIRQGNIARIRDQFRNLDVLLIDDIQFLGGSESTQDEFFHVFNSLHQAGKQIVVTSDRPPKQLSTLEDRLRSRFEWGLITDLKPPNLETRAAILKSKADQIDLTLTNEQVMFVAEHYKSNIRELEGAVKKIFATASLMNLKVDLPMLRNLMEDPKAETAKETKEVKKAANNEDPKVKDEELQGIMKRLNDAITSPPAPQQAVPPPAPSPPPPAPPLKPAYEVKAASEVKATPPPPPVPPTPPPALAVKAAPAAPKPQEAPAPAPASAADEKPDPDEPDADLTLRAVEVVCFYPKGKKADYANLRTKFYLILKKHKLKFRLTRLAERSFIYEGKQDYNYFSRVCKESNCSVALVLGPPPTPLLSEDDFAGMLSTVLEEEKISLQFIPWSEMGKDYRYLNCALDLSLLVPVPKA
ncbi:MAG: hypothetical protein A2901_02240 [Elusimicrobia bacterium RIFCSPLOWO2_01_FULL_54_10]|nr:MAG: hypothetical protein A2901_02240 [Elusimicrobia bacterium RIFCSPLOWO2_01_FULL_54_10]